MPSTSLNSLYTNSLISQNFMSYFLLLSHLTDGKKPKQKRLCNLCKIIELSSKKLEFKSRQLGFRVQAHIFYTVS